MPHVKFCKLLQHRFHHLQDSFLYPFNIIIKFLSWFSRLCFIHRRLLMLSLWVSLAQPRLKYHSRQASSDNPRRHRWCYMAQRQGNQCRRDMYPSWAYKEILFHWLSIFRRTEFLYLLYNISWPVVMIIRISSFIPYQWEQQWHRLSPKKKTEKRKII